MSHYPALIDGEEGAYGVTFPDLPGIVAMGKTVDEAMLNAEEALRDYAVETEADGDEIISPSPLDEIDTLADQRLVSIPLVSGASSERRLHSSTG